MASVISDAHTDFPSQLDNEHPLDFNSVKELPDSHSWVSSDDHHENHPWCDTITTDQEQAPVIDLNDPNAQRLVGQACKTWGVFQVTNHGIPISLLDSIESAGRSLFQLPIQQKLKAARPPDGISGYGLARISTFFPKLMWSEGFTIVGSPLEHASLLWPQPQDYTKFCDVIEEYDRELKKLAVRLMWLILGSINITKEDVKWADPNGDFTGASAALQLNSYPACPDPERAMGLAPHTDSTLLTILHQTTSGLQVQREGHSGWVTVHPLPASLVVNLGDLLHILSNGLYHSVRHRVTVNRTRHRLSVAYLYGPPSNVEISPLSKLVDSFHPPLYRAVTWSEYLSTKAKHFDKALSSVRLCAPISGSGFMDTNDHNSVQVG